jgi:hypothetical protein
LKTDPLFTRRRLLVLPLAVAAVAARAQAVPALRDSLVKAAFLHKFASFVEWPASSFPRPDSPLRIAVIGEEGVFHDLDELARDRDRDGRPVVVSRPGPNEPLGAFHIVYLRASPGRANELLARVPEGVLTVADSEGVHPRGSVLSFFYEDGRVRFGASLEAATRQKLRLSSRLLTVARLSGAMPSRAFG